MIQNHFYSYLHRQIPIIILLSVFPGLGYIFLSWMHNIPTSAIIWYVAILALSAYGYHIYRQYLNNGLNTAQLRTWYNKLKLFYYGFFFLWLVIFLLFISEDENKLHYIAIFTEIGAAVVASVLLFPDKKLYKPNVIMLMIPLAIYFLMINEWFGYVLAIFSLVLTWVLLYAAGSSHTLLMTTNFQANHDSLTGLKNRYFFINHLQRMIGMLHKSNTWSYLLLIDLDHFKTVNDSLGHDVGDRLLKNVSDRITYKKENDSLLARLGGDEFVVVGLEYNSKEQCLLEAEALAQKILSTLKESYVIEMHHLYISASIGVSLIDGISKDANHLIKEADIAMYEAKAAGRDGVIIFDEEMKKRVEDNLEVEQLLRFSLENNEISLAYQPQLDEENKIVGAEVLARWNNEKLGSVRPDIFISIAEKTGFIIELGHYIMESAFQTLSQFEKQGITLNQFSINVSMRQFFYYDFVNNVNDLCIKYLSESSRHKVIFEITESVIAEDVDSVIQIMNEVGKLGIRFSMDDFGTGYSSLSYLKRLPISEIKIDRSFISEIDKEENDQMMVHSILNMANHFDLTVVAEGIETTEQFNFLKANKCELYQGFLFSKPVTEDELKALISQ